MIWALETAERHGRPSCSECGEKMQKLRGCKKPGVNIEGSMAFRFTSPELYRMEKDDAVEDGAYSLLRSCPVGRILSDGPYVYDAIAAHSYAEAGALNPLEATQWLQQALRVVGSERARLRQMEREREAAQRAAAGAGR